MGESLFSPSWYRVASLRPCIRSHAEFHRHLYRGRLWYVLQDHTSGRCHRLTPAAYRLAGLMDGERTTQEIWEAVGTLLGDDAPTQDETIRLLGLLHSADVLRCDVSPDTAELFQRLQRREQAEWWRRFANPLAMRIPLLDPDALLERALPWVRPLFSWAALAVWAVLVATGAVLAAAHWPELTEDAATRMLKPGNVLLLWIAYPIVKLLHELAHAFATKVWGGEVHETGLLVLVLVPAPYVDASAAAAFPDKWRRIVVGAAGIAVELLLASLALFAWLAVEPGVLRSLAWNVMWIGGASTLLFNGNPFLRFDGYYVLQDLIEIPNLAPRSNQYLSSLVLRRAFGLERVRNPVSARGEGRWFVTYGVCSFVYRLVILFAVALFVANRFFVLGVLLALAAVAFQVVVPLLRCVHFVVGSPRLGEKRLRAIAVCGAAAIAGAALTLAVPIPLLTRAEGVVWPPEGAQVRAGADGFVLRVLAAPDGLVRAGDPLIRTRDPTLEAQVAVLEARLRELRARHHAEQRSDRVQAQITLEEIASAAAELGRARERTGEAVIRSPADGTFVVPGSADLAGRFVRQGELLGYVVGPSIDTARVALLQSDAVLVRERTQRVEIRPTSRPAQRLVGTVRREVPAATDRLPSRALGTSGGGRIAVDPTDSDGLRTLEAVFQLDVGLPPAAGARRIGERVYVRFDHGAEPLAPRGYRALRRLFLRRLGV